MVMNNSVFISSSALTSMCQLRG